MYPMLDDNGENRLQIRRLEECSTCHEIASSRASIINTHRTANRQLRSKRNSSSRQQTLSANREPKVRRRNCVWRGIFLPFIIAPNDKEALVSEKTAEGR